MITLKVIKKHTHDTIRILLNDLWFKLFQTDAQRYGRSFPLPKSMASVLFNTTEEFISNNNLLNSYFIKRMNKSFKTTRFDLLLKRWVLDYYYKLFEILLWKVSNKQRSYLVLEDNPLNRLGIEKYHSSFGILPIIKWQANINKLRRFFCIILNIFFVFYFSFKNLIRLSAKRIKYTVMREAIWGLHSCGGDYFHDDFFVDGVRIKKNDVLLFSRGLREKAYNDTKLSDYAHFHLKHLPISTKVFISRILPKYISNGSIALNGVVNSPNFSLFSSIFAFFVLYALPYERVFSNYELISELGHNYFSANHIPESIICQNYGTNYYLIGLSDMSVIEYRYISAFLACDKYFVWGEAHIQNKNIQNEIYAPIGYLFKKFITEVKLNKNTFLQKLGIKPKGKIITFFDENFNCGAKMTESHYLTFWETMLKLIEEEGNNTIVIKLKDSDLYRRLSHELRNRFIKIKSLLEKLDNFYTIDNKRWSFIEAIGISDIVVTMGMTSSATIAIVCGIDGLYLDQAGYDHLFSRIFKGKIVFDRPDDLISCIKKILSGTVKPLNDIPEDILRKFDTFADDRGIEILRDFLTGDKANS